MNNFIKNIIGTFKGNGNCPICNNTFWNSYLTTIWTSKSSGTLVHGECVSKYTREVACQIIAEQENIPSFDVEELNFVPIRPRGILEEADSE